jgi:hypothetical protein
MDITTFTVLVCIALVGWIIFIVGRVFHYDKLSKATLARVEAHPEDIVMAHLVDEDPLELTLQFRGEQPIVMTSVRGVAVVRLFDRIGVIAPQAFRRMTRGGRDMPFDAPACTAQAA